jgi:hypothetical protein
MNNLTIVKWGTGLPRKEGRYLVQIYSGGIDIDYYDIERGWDNYMKGDVLRWTKLSELEDELSAVRSVNSFSDAVNDATVAFSTFNTTLGKINMEELNDD